MRTPLVAILFALSFAAVGPRIVGPQNRSAGMPFVYEPPQDFVPFEGAKNAPTEGVKVWVDAESTRAGGTVHPVRVVLSQSTKSMNVDDGALGELVVEMPKVFEDCAWSHRRHESRTRADGAHVGLIDGECTQTVELGHDLPSQTVRERKLQLVFPDDSGTAIVTASYPADQATRWEPLFEASIGTARGVATRVPPPPSWSYAAWALAGAILGTFAGALGRGPLAPGKGKREPARAGDGR